MLLEAWNGGLDISQPSSIIGSWANWSELPFNHIGQKEKESFRERFISLQQTVANQFHFRQTQQVEKTHRSINLPVMELYEVCVLAMSLGSSPRDTNLLVNVDFSCRKYQRQSFLLHLRFVCASRLSTHFRVISHLIPMSKHFVRVCDAWKSTWVFRKKKMHFSTSAEQAFEWESNSPNNQFEVGSCWDAGFSRSR